VVPSSGAILSDTVVLCRREISLGWLGLSINVVLAIRSLHGPTLALDLVGCVVVLVVASRLSPASFSFLFVFVVSGFVFLIESTKVFCPLRD
jgi:CBS-domain-containing membrane protein